MKGRQGIVAGYNAQAMVSPMETDGGATSMPVTAVELRRRQRASLHSIVLHQTLASEWTCLQMPF